MWSTAIWRRFILPERGLCFRRDFSSTIYVSSMSSFLALLLQPRHSLMLIASLVLVLWFCLFVFEEVLFFDYLQFWWWYCDPCPVNWFICCSNNIIGMVAGPQSSIQATNAWALYICIVRTITLHKRWGLRKHVLAVWPCGGRYFCRWL